MCKPFSIKLIYLIERRSFDQMYKFSNKNDMVCEWRNFQNNLVAYLHMIIETLSHKFHPYSILTGQVTVEWLTYQVLKISAFVHRPYCFAAFQTNFINNSHKNTYYVCLENLSKLKIKVFFSQCQLGIAKKIKIS